MSLTFGMPVRAIGARHRLTLGAVLCAFLSCAAPARADISCSLVPTLGVSGVLGMPAALVTMVGPSADAAIPTVTDTNCNYTGGSGTILLRVLDFPSAGDAGQVFGEALVIARFKEVDDPDAKSITVASEPGLGGPAFSAITVRTAGYAALKGSHIVLLGASRPGLSPAELSPKVKSLMATVLGKL